ncbi:MAG: hypothetical protein WC058_07730 [Phycisphaeraceae bacterium]
MNDAPKHPDFKLSCKAVLCPDVVSRVGTRANASSVLKQVSLRFAVCGLRLKPENRKLESSITLLAFALRVETRLSGGIRGRLIGLNDVF